MVLVSFRAVLGFRAVSEQFKLVFSWFQMVLDGFSKFRSSFSAVLYGFIKFQSSFGAVLGFSAVSEQFQSSLS